MEERAWSTGLASSQLWSLAIIVLALIAAACSPSAQPRDSTVEEGLSWIERGVRGKGWLPRTSIHPGTLEKGNEPHLGMWRDRNGFTYQQPLAIFWG